MGSFTLIGPLQRPERHRKALFSFVKLQFYKCAFGNQGTKLFDNRSLNPHSTSCLSKAAIAVDVEEELLVEVDLVAEVEVLYYIQDGNFY